MANHGFISSKSNLTPDKVRADLEEINQRRFKGRLSIRDDFYVIPGSWFVCYTNTGVGEWPIGFNIWITSTRKLEHKHSHDWVFYLEVVFSTELAAKYKGLISDEGGSEKWKPDLTKYPNYETWVRQGLYSNWMDVDQKRVEYFIQKELMSAPEELRDC